MPPLWRAALTYVVYFAAFGSSWPYLPVYYRDLGLDLGTIGLLAALAAATQLIGSPIWGGVADRFPRSRLVLPAAAVVAVVGASVLVGAATLPGVAVGALVLALGGAGIGPLLDARTLDILGADRIRYGQLRAWGSLAFVVGAWLVGGLIDARGSDGLFLAYIPMLGLTALITLTLPRRSPATRTVSIFRGAWSLIRAPEMRLFLFGALLVWTMLQAANSFYSIQIVALGGSAQTVGLAWAVGALIEVPLMFGFPRLAERFGAERLLVVGAAAFAVRAAAAALATDATTLVLIAPIEGLAFALFFVGGVAYVASRASSELAATAQGVYAGMAGLASIIGSALGGIVAGALSIASLFAVAAVCSGVAAAVIAFAVRSRTPAGPAIGGASAGNPPEAGGPVEVATE